MKDTLFLGVGRHLTSLPAAVWHRHVHGDANLEFMSVDHHRIRNFVVMELPRVNQPISMGDISQALDLPLEQVVKIVEDLEKRMTFLYRSDGESVTWAYPVTVEQTPHHITFSTGEQIYAA
jgi:hypothetical protein